MEDLCGERFQPCYQQPDLIQLISCAQLREPVLIRVHLTRNAFRYSAYQLQDIQKKIGNNRDPDVKNTLLSSFQSTQIFYSRSAVLSLENQSGQDPLLTKSMYSAYLLQDAHKQR
jgi:hypothetical protein